jgi:hypothetical protein
MGRSLELQRYGGDPERHYDLFTVRHPKKQVDRIPRPRIHVP